MDLTHQNASGESGNALSNGGILRSKAAVSTILWEYSILYLTCLSLRVENRPSVLGIFIYVPWGGVGWGNNVHVLASVPDQLTSCPVNEQKLNDLIWTYVRTWQWRWEANVVGKALLEKTGAYLAKM